MSDNNTENNVIYRLFVKACNLGDFEMIKNLKPTLDMVKENHHTLLKRACASGNLDIVKYFISPGLSSIDFDSIGVNLVRSSYGRKSMDMCELILGQMSHDAIKTSYGDLLKILCANSIREVLRELNVAESADNKIIFDARYAQELTRYSVYETSVCMVILKGALTSQELADIKLNQ